MTQISTNIDRRIRMLGSHLSASPPSGGSSSHGKGLQKHCVAKNELSKIKKWNGWGYEDTAFAVTESGVVTLTGKRYDELFPAGRLMPKFRDWIESTIDGFNFNTTSPPQPSPPQLPAPKRVQEFIDATAGHCATLTFDDMERLQHSHGCNNAEMYAMRYGELKRYVDAVIYPRKHEDVEAIMQAAVKFNVCLIPFGGGTSVTEGLLVPDTEERMVVSLCTKLMNKIKWVDRDSMMACIEAGAVGVDILDELDARGLRMGHEPDSQEFSTMGGWVATRASGMKKNVYGNIEDIVVDFKLVTPIGTLSKTAVGAPRVSIGPDLLQMAIGSEGTLGIVTDVVVRLRPKPEVQNYGSVIFPTFEQGVACLREVALKRLQPASIRLVDNLQFKFGQVLKPKSASPLTHAVVSAAQKFFVTKIKGFSEDTICAATLLFEGSKAETDMQSKGVYNLIGKYGGMAAGAENGRRGYFLTYMIAYLRDFGYDYYMCAESFETSCPWSQVLPLCHNVKKRIVQACINHGVPGAPFVSCRVTQTYDTGACVYFYLAFCFRGMDDPVHAYEEIEAEARDEVLAQGGSLSHHHGIGKCRVKWMKQALSPVGINMMKALKTQLDPTNILCCGNLGL